MNKREREREREIERERNKSFKYFVLKIKSIKSYLKIKSSIKIIEFNPSKRTISGATLK